MSVSKWDQLVTPDKAYAPDDRNHSFGINDIAAQYALIESYVLGDYVPEKIATQYEVARNLYLYAFHVYRFYMTAQHQLLTVLEMAIKERFGEIELKAYAKEIGKRPGLYVCLRLIFDKGYIENSDFPIWHKRPKIQAEHDYLIEMIKEMESKGLDSIDLDYSKAEITAKPEDHDYLEVLLGYLPKMRNTHAHGTSMLHDDVLLMFENVSIIINIIFKK